ncbi:hypothetical protein HFN76_18185 [Rhizobium laguerreae]|uniref:hypothetical protein n=1 Tax=Rhizobium laguerreae TaxID=1076926 RepID=UPI001C922AF5|nr:hypothetical protein [Rhizobium laguerreae]MBY3514146.1 hypothetical protein [Rhizobium laguerreae]
MQRRVPVVASAARWQPKGHLLGGTVMEAGEFENHAQPRQHRHYLGGMAAEQVFLGEHGDGVTSDLDGATPDGQRLHGRREHMSGPMTIADCRRSPAGKG